MDAGTEKPSLTRIGSQAFRRMGRRAQETVVNAVDQFVSAGLVFRYPDDVRFSTTEVITVTPEMLKVLQKQLVDLSMALRKTNDPLDHLPYFSLSDGGFEGMARALGAHVLVRQERATDKGPVMFVLDPSCDPK